MAAKREEKKMKGIAAKCEKGGFFVEEPEREWAEGPGRMDGFWREPNPRQHRELNTGGDARHVTTRAGAFCEQIRVFSCRPR